VPNELLIPSAVVTSEFAALLPDESAAPAAGMSLFRHEVWSAGPWYPRIHDLDILEEALATLAWNQV
jgi:hypothetical protein